MSLSPLSRASLERLRGRFEAGNEKYPGLRCVLAQTADGTDADDLLRRAAGREFGVLEERPPSWSWGAGLRRYEWVPVGEDKEARVPRFGRCYKVWFLYPGRSGWWHGTVETADTGRAETALTKFTELADDAGHVLRGYAKPLELAPEKIRESAYLPFNRCGWLSVVFWLAWECREGSTLRAWCNHADGQPAEPDAETLVSVLPTSPFWASVMAIELLLSEWTGDSGDLVDSGGEDSESQEADVGATQKDPDDDDDDCVDLTISQAAHRVGCHRNTMRNWIKQFEIKTTPLATGSKYRFKKVDIEDKKKDHVSKQKAAKKLR